MKFTAYEARGIADLVSHSPLLSWFYDVLSVQGFSTFLGILELTVGALIAARLVNPALSFAGGLLSAGLFFTTLSFMASTPGVFEPKLGFPAISVAPGRFLLKDIGLLAISLWIAVDSLRAIRRRIVARVRFNTMTNYINQALSRAIDFPAVTKPAA
jgi:uncharacterized membrane protein YkgB